MKFAKTTLNNTVEILAAKDFVAIPVTLEEDTLAGAVVETDDATGILLYDVKVDENPNGALVVAGVIDATKAQAHAGVTYDSEDYAAMPGIVFRTNIGVNDDGE